MASCLVLAGPPGAGKSTVGARCAARLGWRFVDTDDELARRQGLAVPAIFARHGESYFRACEVELLNELAGASEVVIAVGGGTVVPAPTRALLRTLGVCLGLTATPAELGRRLGPDAGATRPLLQGPSVEQRLAELLTERAAAYRDLPYHLDTTAMPADAVAALACAILAAESARLTVAHPTGTYDIVIGTDLLRYLGYALAGRQYRGPLAIVSDSHVGPLYAERVQASLRAAGLDSCVHLIEAGEPHKNLDTMARLYQSVAASGVLRGGAIVALGGGVVGDVAGLLAATYLRGIGLVQVPTSLLAMADSSIGGKVGVDIAAGKNLVGAFKHPDLVCMDLSCLCTLPAEELRAGLGEVVKAAIIAGGAAFARVQALTGVEPDSPALRTVLTDALCTKRVLVEEDPEEQGRRILLNLGHTFAHGLESFSEYRLRHGEAVALGLLCAARLAVSLRLCEAALPATLCDLFHRLGLPTMLPIGAINDDDAIRQRLISHAVESIWAFMQRDKKRLSRQIRFVLLRAPGDVFPYELADDQLGKDAVRALFGDNADSTMAEHKRGPYEAHGLMRENG